MFGAYNWVTCHRHPVGPADLARAAGTESYSQLLIRRGAAEPRPGSGGDRHISRHPGLEAPRAGARLGGWDCIRVGSIPRHGAALVT